jgi:oxygen-dependent protoporphyrinogen oxidase
MRHTVVIGGGISGLSAAYQLAKAGAPATIIESRSRLGGVIQTEHVDGCTIEAGPDSFLSAKPAAMELIRELGLAADVIGSNDHQRVTFVQKRGRLVQLPDGLMMMAPTKLRPMVTTRLLGLRTKLRMGLELLRAPKMKGQDESVADFVRRHYGQEAVDYLAEPLLSGIYGGDPRLLSARAVLPRFVDLAEKYGSLTLGAIALRAQAANGRQTAPLFRTLKGGLGQMVGAIEARIAGKTELVRGRVEAIERAGAGYRVRVTGDWIAADHLVLACEAHAAAPLIAPLDARIAELLSAVQYSSSMTVAMGYDAADFERPPAGFGFLVPKKERRKLVACTWVGTKFANRVPDGKVVARCFLGGVDGESALAESDESVTATVIDELRRIAGVTAHPRFTRIFRWPRSMAQYAVGHGARMAELDSRLAGLAGLYVAGNAYQGIGIPDCIRMGRAAAEKILTAG